MDAADRAFERWAYGEGWSAGMIAGGRRGFDEGYAAGFDAGAEVGAARILLGIEHALGGRVLDLLPGLPQVAEYAAHRERTARSDEPCAYGCRACSRCVRAAAAVANVARYGSVDRPGASAVQKGRCR